jgi:hypothetical protein
MTDAEFDKLKPYNVELPVREGRRVVFDVRAENRPSAVREARRFLELDVAWSEGDYDEYSKDLKLVWNNNFGIVGWRGYNVETTSV